MAFEPQSVLVFRGTIAAASLKHREQARVRQAVSRVFRGTIAAASLKHADAERAGVLPRDRVFRGTIAAASLKHRTRARGWG